MKQLPAGRTRGRPPTPTRRYFVAAVCRHCRAPFIIIMPEDRDYARCNQVFYCGDRCASADEFSGPRAARAQRNGGYQRCFVGAYCQRCGRAYLQVEASAASYRASFKAVYCSAGCTKKARKKRQSDRKEPGRMRCPGCDQPVTGAPYCGGCFKFAVLACLTKKRVLPDDRVPEWTYYECALCDSLHHTEHGSHRSKRISAVLAALRPHYLHMIANRTWIDRVLERNQHVLRIPAVLEANTRNTGLIRS